MKTAFFSVCMLVLAAPAYCQSPRFDCGKAASPDEIAICSDPYLIILEQIAADGYQQLKAEQGVDAAKETARSILRDRQHCGNDKACLYGVLSHAVRFYQSARAPSSQVQKMNRLISDWDKVNTDCRGSYDRAIIDKACTLREIVSMQLEDMGLCQGAYLLDDPDFGMATLLREHWVPCLYKELQN